MKVESAADQFWSLPLPDDITPSMTSNYQLQLLQSPNCTLHTASTHVILALEWQSLTYDYAIGIHMKMQNSNTAITWVIAVCNV